jgi:hypothetical protein
MLLRQDTKAPNLISRTGLWIGSCLLLAAGICGFFGKIGSLDVGLSIASVFVLPACLLNLPVVFKLKDAERKHMWVILGVGLLVGPVVLSLLFAMAVIRGQSPLSVWQGDPLGPHTFVLLIASAIVTLALSAIYGLLLRILSHRQRLASH